MQQTQAKLEKFLLNKPLTKIEFFNVNENYFEVKPEHSWIFDGGVELHFGNEIFTLAWDHGNDSFDYILEGGVQLLLKDLEYYAVEAQSISNISNLIGQTINDIQFEWEYYQDFDENGQLKDEKIYVPMGLRLTFSNGSLLQIATIESRLNAETFELVDAYYNLVGQLLISIDNDIEIEKQKLEFE